MEIPDRQESKRVLKNTKAEWLPYLKTTYTHLKCTYKRMAKAGYSETATAETKAKLLIYAGAYNRDRAMYDKGCVAWGSAIAHMEHDLPPGYVQKKFCYYFAEMPDALGEMSGGAWWR